MRRGEGIRRRTDKGDKGVNRVRVWLMRTCCRIYKWWYMLYTCPVPCSPGSEDRRVSPLTHRRPCATTHRLTGHLTGHLTGNLTGRLTGNLTGNLTGRLTGNLTGHLTGRWWWQLLQGPGRTSAGLGSPIAWEPPPAAADEATAARG